MKKNKWIAVILAILMAITMSACGGSDSSDTESTDGTAAETEFNPADYPIGVVACIRTHPVIQAWLAGTIKKAKELGYPIYVYAVDGDNANEAIALAEAGIAQHGLKGMVLPTIVENNKEVTDRWAKQGVVTAYGHGQISEADAPNIIGWAASDAADQGKTAAKAIGEALGGKGTVAITCGSYKLNEAVSADTFMEVMAKDYPNIKVLEPQEEGFDTPIAIQRATSILQANPDVAAAYSTTGSGAVTWASAQKNAGKKIVIVSMDYTEANLDLVKNGEVYGLLAQPLVPEFEKCVELLDAYFRGEPFEHDNIMDCPLITVDNVDEYYALVEEVKEIMKEYN